jgi:hypothetical protein
MAHLADGYGAEVSRQTISTITEVLEGMAGRQSSRNGDGSGLKTVSYVVKRRSRL